MKLRVLLTSVSLLAGITVWAQDSKFAIWHVSLHLPDITAYLEVPQENGGNSKFVLADISGASIEGQPLKLDNVTVSQGFGYTFLLDISGSIKRPRQIRDAIDSWIDGLPSGNQVEIYVFGNVPESVDRAKLDSILQQEKFADLTTQLY